MPAEEDGVEVHTKGLIDVDGGEVVTTIDGSRDLTGGNLGGELGEAEDGIDVLFTFGEIK